MINNFKKNNKGMSLVEIVFYVAIFSILSIVVVNSMITMMKSFKEVSIHRQITQGGGQIMERISREIREAQQISSVVDANGDIILNTKDVSGNPKLIEFRLNNENIEIVESNTVSLAIGDTLQGGKVGYILQSGDPGYVADGKIRGFIVLPSDYPGNYGVVWGNSPCYGTDISGASGTNIGTGLQNTRDMFSALCYMGTLVNGVIINGYNDWYIPSQDELNKFYPNKTTLGFTYGVRYWTSTERSANEAWGQDFYLGTQDYISKNNAIAYLRPIRNFVYDGRTFLNSPNVKVTALSFDQINTTKGQAVKMSLTIGSNNDPLNRTYNFYDTIVLRGNY